MDAVEFMMGQEHKQGDSDSKLSQFIKEELLDTYPDLTDSDIYIAEKEQELPTTNHKQVIINNSNKQVVKSGHNKWGLLSREWNLKKAAADYYLLQLATVADSIQFQPYLDRVTKNLTDQFARYTDMAIGGEIRHMTDRNYLPKRLREALGNGTLQGGRSSSWEGWYWVRKQYGTVALRWLVQAYNATYRWKSGYGGEPWGNISNTLLQWEIGNISDTVFIDTCWGLQHNGGKYFDKWWNTYGLASVLDHNLRGEYCMVKYDASNRIQHLIPKEIIEEFCLCGIHSGD